MFLLYAYRFLTILLFPAIAVYLLIRRNKGKEDGQRWQERFGKASFPRPSGTVVWLHAASVGESVSMLPLIHLLVERYKDIHVLVTTGTVTSAAMLNKRLPDRAFHQYVPIDSALCVHSFLRHWRPNIAVWVESELWPNLITQTQKQCAIVLLNGRISGKSYNKWRHYKSLSKVVLRCFSLIMPQSEEDARRFEFLGGKNVKYMGNLKFDAPTLPAPSKAMGAMLSMIGERPVWVAASTHHNEEERIAKVHMKLKEEYPTLLTIIVPRHVKRGADIVSQVEKLHLSAALRSKEETITDITDIYIADTMGELGIFYRLSPIVFVGGSLIPHGGQNPLEPARLECAIVLGPYMDNFMEVTKELESKEACLRVQDDEELRETIDSLLKDHTKQEKLANAAKALIEEKSGLLEHVVEQLIPYFDAAQ